ncbi:MAG: hypothetical protein ABEJ44_01340 [Halanaeroarchaeum sp.]
MELPIHDRLDAIGTVVGAFVLLLALEGVVTRPWRYTGGGSIMVLQIVGILATVAIGVGLIYLSHFVE